MWWPARKLTRFDAASAAIAMVATLGLAQSVSAQRGVVGNIAPGASVPRSASNPAAQHTPVGGLQGSAIPHAPLRGSLLSPYGTFGVRVIDAPLPRPGIVTTSENSAPSSPAWMPTYDKPVWTRDSTAQPSDLWRSLLVRDVVCNPMGRCVPRTSRVQARWIARCDCYAFADGWGRVWHVEDRR